MSPDIWRWWKKALEDQSLIGTEELPIHDGEPHIGYYRIPDKENATWNHVAIWYDDQHNLIARVNNQTVDPKKIWMQCCRNPITYELYCDRVNGLPWPDAYIAQAGIGHNQPPEEEPKDEYEKLKKEIELARERAWKIGPLSTQEEADYAGNLRDALNGFYKKAEELRKEEKKPFDESAKKVQAKWKPLIDEAKETADMLRDGPINSYLKKKEAERQEEIKKIEEEEAAEKKRLEEEVKRAEQDGTPAPIQVKTKKKRKPPPPRVGGAGGKRTALKNIIEIEIVDYDACVQSLKSNPEIKEAIESLAKRIIKAGGQIPGVTMKKGKGAV